jgi:iron complex transport system substrate-binding protein
MRICSLQPGATEIVAALGLADHLVALSHECDYPPAIAGLPVVTKPFTAPSTTSCREIDQTVAERIAAGAPLFEIDTAALTTADPDLLIVQDLCHVCGITPDHLEQALTSLPARPKMVTVGGSTLEEVFRDIVRIGQATDRAEAARSLVDDLRSRCETVRNRQSARTRQPKVVSLEWLDPFYVAGHWTPELVVLAGGRDVLGTAGAPSRKVSWKDMVAAEPDVLLVMPCGFTLERTVEELHSHCPALPWDRLPAVQNGRVFALDGNAHFSRPGPRLIDGLEILEVLLAGDDPAACTPPGARHITWLQDHIKV